MILDETTARRFARLTLGHVTRPWPYKLDHVMNGPEDVATPAALHPIFHGSFDFHSCVHGWWQLLTLARLFPAIPEARDIATLPDAMLTGDKVAGERAYLDRPGAGGSSRPYGWAWVLALHAEAARGGRGPVLEPLARDFAARFGPYLTKLTYPIRTGTHFNTAFACLTIRDWATTYNPSLAALVDARARDWFEGDAGCQAWEPGGDEFLSPALVEATLMAAVLGDGFARWFDGFLPAIPDRLLDPAHVSDRSDGKIAHLDGLNLSRAWCWRTVARALGDEHPVSAVARASAERHLAAALPHLDADYMGEHWLATYALLALTA